MRLVLLTIFIFPAICFAQVRPFQTTRLQSTGGTGVASLLVTEAALLNPASLAFFEDAFASYQNTRSTLKNKNDNRDNDNHPWPNGNRHEGYFVYDNSGDLKGGFSYQQQREGGFERQRATGTMAAAISPTVGFGVTYHHSQDSRPLWYSKNRHIVSHSMTVGLTWIKSENFVVGLVWEDPARALATESKAIVGAQYSLTGDLQVMLDLGMDPALGMKDHSLWRGAAQYNIFADFFLRAGKFRDQTQNLEGTGWGIGWTGPKLGIDLSMRQSRQIKNSSSNFYPKENISDFSFSVNLRF